MTKSIKQTYFIQAKESSDQEKITSKATIENSESTTLDNGATTLNDEATTLTLTGNGDNIVFPDENGENNISDDFRYILAANLF